MTNLLCLHSNFSYFYIGIHVSCCFALLIGPLNYVTFDFIWWSFTRNSVEDILQVLIVFAVESLELDFALLFPERHILLRVLPVLVVLATSSEKDSESLYKRVKINRLITIFKVYKMTLSLKALVCQVWRLVIIYGSNCSFLVEWSSHTCIPGSSSFSSCNFERVVYVLSQIHCPNSSPQSFSASWASTPRSTRISSYSFYFNLFIYLIESLDKMIFLLCFLFFLVDFFLSHVIFYLNWASVILVDCWC